MDREQKQTFVSNVIKLIVGAILLIISFLYLQNHPAERVSVISWFEVMYQKVQYWTYWLLGKDVVVLQQKFRLLQYYQELIRKAENMQCVGDIIKNIHDDYNALRHIPMNELSEKIDEYSNRAYDFDAQLQDGCDSAS